MEYIISEEELKELIPGYSEYPYQKLSKEYKEYVEDFLKSKQPIELVAEGKADSAGGTWNIGPYCSYEFRELIEKYKGNIIKIYIQKAKQ